MEAIDKRYLRWSVYVYQEMAEHYGTAIIPARVRAPKDKPNAEGSVGNISTWITAALRNEQFFSLSELNRAIRQKLEDAYGHFPRPSGPRSPARQGHIKRPVLRLAEQRFLHPANQCCLLLIEGLCLLNKYSKSSSKSATNAIKLTITLWFITQFEPSFIRRILTTEERGCSKIIPEF